MNDDIKRELAALGFLDETSLERRATLLATVSKLSFEPGETIYQHDDENKSLYVLRQGLIKLLTYLSNGQSRIVRLHKPGSMIGLDGLMDSRHGHTAVAIDKVEVFLVPHVELLRLKEEEPQLYASLLENWHAYLVYADTWITEFSTGKIRGRVARLVHFLARFDEDTGPQNVELLTTEEMSDILGVTPESVSRVVADFKREGILKSIENTSESLFSCDLHRLKAERRE